MAQKLLKNLGYCLICVCAAWFAAEAARGLSRSPEETAAPPKLAVAAPKPEPRKEPRTGGYETVLRRNLFRAPVEPGAAWSPYGAEKGAMSPAEEALLAAEMDKLPISQQGWTLLGTIVNTLSPSENRAILSGDNIQGAYGPGSEIKGWKIAHIDRRRVVVEKNGRRERLLVGGSETKLPDNNSAKPVAAKIRLNGGEIDRALRNIPALLTQAGFEPGQKNGLMGLNLTFVKPDGIFARLGLRPDDMLLEANGQTLTSLGDLARLGSLAREESLRVELLRDGQNVVLEYNIAR